MKKNILLLLLAFLPLLCLAQYKNAYHLGYGKPAGNDFGENHVFFFEYSRFLKKKVFLTFRTEFTSEEEILNGNFEYEAYYVILPGKPFALEGAIQHDDVKMGLKQLETHDAFDHNWHFSILAGYDWHFCKKFHLWISGGGGIYYAKDKGLYSGIIANTTESQFPATHGALLMESYKRGLGFSLNGNLKLTCDITDKIYAGVDGTIVSDAGSSALNHSVFFGFRF